jgi:hypothetical protein
MSDLTEILSKIEAGNVLGMSRSTAYENWEFARSWFATQFGSHSQ